MLVVSVIQRSKDIGILRAMGTSRGQILRVFLIQGGLLGFVGSLFGSAMGAVALIYWHSVARQVDGSELFPLILERRLFIADRIAGDADGVAGRDGAGAARRQTRSGGGDPWLRKSCASRRSARPTMSACRPRPRCCTIST